MQYKCISISFCEGNQVLCALQYKVQYTVKCTVQCSVQCTLGREVSFLRDKASSSSHLDVLVQYFIQYSMHYSIH